MEMGVDEVMKYVVEKLKEALLAVENLGGDALAWFDNVFPPETRRSTVTHWFHVALPWIIAAVALTVVFWLFRCCCCWLFRCCGWFCRRCCCCGGRGRVRMMKAPGRNCRMQRSVFAASPQGYFSNLRAHPADHLC